LQQSRYIFRAIALLALCIITVRIFAKYATVPVITFQEKWECGTVDPPAPSISLDETGWKGKASFQAKCQSCHFVLKDVTGPALYTVEENPFWTDNKKIAAYLRNPESFLKYDYIKQLREKFGSKHMAFPEITEEEVSQIMAYVSAAANRRVY
jgi:cytochrome c2